MKLAGLLRPQRFKITPKSTLMLRRSIPKILALSAVQRQIEASRSTRPLMRLQQGLVRGLITNIFNTLAQTFKLKSGQLRGGVVGIDGGVKGGVLGIGGGVEGGVLGIGGGVDGGVLGIGGGV
jgi:hypothetical protein